MEYTTPHTPKLNRVIERRFAVIKEREFKRVLNEKLNETDHQMIWAEPDHTCERVINSMDDIVSNTSPFENSMEKTQYRWFILGVWTYWIRH